MVVNAEVNIGLNLTDPEQIMNNAHEIYMDALNQLSDKGNVKGENVIPMTYITAVANFQQNRALFYQNKKILQFLELLLSKD